MMELTEDFLKLLEITITVVGVLAIFFTYIQYNIIVSQDEAERQAIIFGNYLLKSSCLTDGTKSLFLETKLDSATQDCFNYHQGKITIELLDETKSWTYQITNPLVGKAEFIVSVRMTGGSIKPAKMTVEM